VKKVTITLILILVIVLLSPPIVGMQARGALEESLQQAAEQTGDYLQISLQAYDNGWFEGQGEIHIALSDAYLGTLFHDDPDSRLAQQLQQGLVQQVHINHGPVVLSNGVQLQLGQAVAVIDAASHPQLAKLLRNTGNEYLLKLSLDLGFGGSSNLRLEAPAFTASMEGDNRTAELIFAGGAVSGSFDFNTMHLVLDGQMNGFSVRGADGEAVVERTMLSSDMAYPDSDPYGLGSGSIAIDRMVGMQGTTTAFDLSQARFDFASTQQGETLLLQADYRIGQLISGGSTYQDLQVTLIADKVARQAMRQLQSLETDVTSNQPPDKLMISLQAPVHQLLTEGLTVKVAPFKLIYDGKPLHASLTARSLPQALPPLGAFRLDDAAMWMTSLQVEADVHLHRDLATELLIPQIRQLLLAGVPADTQVDEAQLDAMARAQAPLMLGALIGQGILREDQDSLLIAARFSNGEMSVNGNPFPLESLLMQP